MSLRRQWTFTLLALLVAFAAVEIILSRQINLFGASYAAGEWVASAYRRSARAYQRSLARRLETQARLIAEMPSVAAALRRGDRALVQAEIDARWRPESPAAEFWFVAPRDPARFWAASVSSPCAQPALAAALDRPSGPGPRFVICDGVPALLVAIPLGGAAAPDGWIGLGYRLGEEYVDGLHEVTSTEITLLGDAGIIATTVKDRAGRRAPMPLDGDVARGILGPGEYAARTTVAMADYGGFSEVFKDYPSDFDIVLHSGPVDQGAGALPIRLVLAVPLNLMTVGVRYSTLMMIGGTVVMILALLFLVPRLLAGATRSLEALVVVAEEVAAGNLEVSAPVPPIEELARLAVAFNAMVQSLSDTQARLVASQKMVAIGQITAGLAHELNNPLTVILGFAQGMERRVPEESPLRLPVAGIIREAKRCAALIRELLTYARTGSHAWEPVSLNAAVEAVVPLVMVRLKEQQIVLDVDLAPGLPEILGSRSQIEQILVNLVNNAVDAMPGGGSLTIRTRRELPDQACLEVRDTGQGMPEEVRAKIFQPFFTTKEAGKGTGLGLSIVHGIVEAQGADIRVESEVGRGTAFTVTWPPPAPVPGAQRGTTMRSGRDTLPSRPSGGAG